MTCFGDSKEIMLTWAAAQFYEIVGEEIVRRVGDAVVVES